MCGSFPTAELRAVDTGALLSRTYALPCGPRVRLRLSRSTDRAGIAELLAQRGIEPQPADLDAVTRYDPRKRVAICATTPLEGREAIVGVGSIDLETESEPDVLVVDEELTHGLGELLAAALTNNGDRARAVQSARRDNRPRWKPRRTAGRRPAHRTGRQRQPRWPRLRARLSRSIRRQGS